MLVETKLTKWAQLKEELAGVGVLPQLAVLKHLDGQVARVQFRLHIRPQRREGVKGFGPRPLALGVLDGAVADVLRGGVAKDVAGGGGGGDVADAAADDNGQFGLEIGAMMRIGDLDPGAIGNEGSGGLEPEERLFGQRLVLLAGVVGVIETDGDDFGGRHRSEGLEALEGERLFVERGRAKDIAADAEKPALHDFGVEDLVTFLKAAIRSHNGAR